jgi:hypothetical protein
MPQKRLAITISGAVSLRSYVAGVLFELGLSALNICFGCFPTALRGKKQGFKTSMRGYFR